jgi:hypothetical protein
VVNYLICSSGTATVAKILGLANDLLGGVLVPGQLVNGCAVPSYSDVNDAVDFFNTSFDQCKGFDGFGNCFPPTVARAVVSPAGDGLKVTTHPNPFTTKVTFRITSPVSGEATLAVYNVAGQRVGIVYQGWLDAGAVKDVEYNNPPKAHGILFYTLTQHDKSVRGKIIHAE